MLKKILPILAIVMVLSLLLFACAKKDENKQELKPDTPDNPDNPPAHVHEWDEGTVTKEAVCTETGVKTYTCMTCGENKIEWIPALGHTEVIDPAKAATCIETGLTEGKHCSVCNAVLVAQEVLLVIDHTYENKVCTVCGAKEPSMDLAFTSNGNGTCYVSGIGTCTDTEITIPSHSPNGDTVTAIGEKAFADQTNITGVVIPTSVTTIGKRAFYNTGLTEIRIPSSVTSIGTQIFYKANNLATVYYDSPYLPSNATENQFLNNSSIKKIVFGKNANLYYAPEWFGFQNNNLEIELANGRTYIGDHAFYNCSKLLSITIPDSVTSIGRCAFSYCLALTSITIPDSVTSIGGEAFVGCSSLTSIKIPDGVTSIGGSVFYNCSSLTGITIPDSVTSIGSYAFYWCTSLTGITIPDSVTSIGDFAFSDCSALESITIPDSVTSIGGEAFCSCTSLTSITIPDSVTSIGGEAFAGCSSLTSIKIPDSVTSIGSYAFYYCSKLTSITYTGTMTQWNAISKDSDWIYDTGNYTIHCTDGDIAK